MRLASAARPRWRPGKARKLQLQLRVQQSTTLRRRRGAPRAQRPRARRHRARQVERDARQVERDARQVERDGFADEAFDEADVAECERVLFDLGVASRRARARLLARHAGPFASPSELRTRLSRMCALLGADDGDLAELLEKEGGAEAVEMGVACIARQLNVLRCELPRSADVCAAVLQVRKRVPCEEVEWPLCDCGVECVEVADRSVRSLGCWRSMPPTWRPRTQRCRRISRTLTWASCGTSGRTLWQ